MKQHNRRSWIQGVRPALLGATLAAGVFCAPIFAGEDAPEGPPAGGPPPQGEEFHHPEGRPGGRPELRGEGPRGERPGRPGERGGPGGEMGLKAADTNHDGTITKEEFMAFHEGLFAKLDANGDGKIDEAEVRAQMEKRREELRGTAREMMERRGRGPREGGPRGEGGPAGPPPGAAPRPPDGDFEPPQGGPHPEDEPRFAPDGVTPRAPRPEERTGQSPEGKKTESNLEISQKIMNALDANGDGRIEKEEAPERLTAVFDRLDTNKDGALGPEDGGLLHRLKEREHAMGERGRMLLERFDKNGDGKLQKEEMPEKLAARFEDMDKNGDGAIDPSELGGDERGEGLRKPGKAGQKHGLKGDKKAEDKGGEKSNPEAQAPGDTK